MPKEVKLYLFYRTECDTMQYSARASLSVTSSTDAFVRRPSPCAGQAERSLGTYAAP